MTGLDQNSQHCTVYIVHINTILNFPQTCTHTYKPNKLTMDTFHVAERVGNVDMEN